MNGMKQSVTDNITNIKITTLKSWAKPSTKKLLIQKNWKPLVSYAYSIFGKLRLLNLNFEDILDEYNGLYILEVKHPKKRYLTSSQIISLSDIGMITKVGKDAIYVFLNSIKTTQPIPGATVTLYDQTNQKLLSRPSDGEGVVKFSYKDMTMIDPVVNFVEAKTTTDFNFLPFKHSQMNSSIPAITRLTFMGSGSYIAQVKP